MTTEEKIVLHYDVIANTAHKIEKIAKNLANNYRGSYFESKKATQDRDNLCKYFNELNQLMQTI